MSQCLSPSLGQMQNAFRKSLYESHLRKAFSNKAEREGFEPSDPLIGSHGFSKPAHSTTLPPLQVLMAQGLSTFHDTRVPLRRELLALTTPAGRRARVLRKVQILCQRAVQTRIPQRRRQTSPRSQKSPRPISPFSHTVTASVRRRSKDACGTLAPEGIGLRRCNDARTLLVRP